MPGVFVTGTDTDAGKTVVSCALIRALRAGGLDIGGMKPIETGVGEAGPLDGQALQAAAGGGDPLELVCPLRFALPAAPNVAAAAEGRSIELDRVREAYDALGARHDAMLVEGAGGLLVPVDDRMDMGDLSRWLGLPLVLVARAALGTINHTLLSLAEIERRGLELAAVVVTHSAGPLSEADQANFAHLRGVLQTRLGSRYLGEVPPMADGETEADASELDLGALRAAIRG